MIQIIVLLEILDKKACQQYEICAINIMKIYGGELIYAFRPDIKESTAGNINEVHYLQFPDLISFKQYQKDSKLLEMSPLRDKAISNTKIIISSQFINYKDLCT